MNAPLWSVDALVEIMHARPLGPSAAPVTGISIDSRTIEPGDAFFAIGGDNLDGHAYVGSALAREASVAVVAQEKLARLGKVTGPMLVVDNVLEALGRLGAAARARMNGKIVAVTGSVGKTTTKDMLRLALGSSGAVHAAPASFNNHWGVPLTLARMPPDTEFGIFEIGMNHAGEITPLTAMVRPDAAIITAVTAAHLGAFASVEDIARAKGEIFSGIVRGGAAIVNRDNGHFSLLVDLAHRQGVTRILSFGEDADADIRLEDAQLGPSGSEVQVTIAGNRIRYSLAVPGAHIIANSLAVLASVEALGADVEAAAAALGAFSAGKGRGERVLLRLPEGSALLIDESYNANPASMEAALTVLGRSQPRGSGRRIAVLGDMLELGDSERELHLALAEPVLRSGTDIVCLAGPLMQMLWDLVPPERRGFCADAPMDLLEPLAADLRPGDVVMVKGSNGLRMRSLVDALTERFGPTVAGRQGT